MIINSSQIAFSAEHERSEFRGMTSTLDDRGQGSQFVAQLEALIARSQMVGAGDVAEAVTDADSANRLSFGSASPINPFRGFFQTVEGDDYQNQENITQARLWQSLLKAIQPDFPSQPLPQLLPQPLSQLDSAAFRLAELPEGNQPVQMQPRVLRLQLNVSETIEEYECTRFNSCGTVNTADGRSIEFDLSLEMERSYSATREYKETQELVFTDPLILNFEGNYADLSNDKFDFDLDADGDKELISYLTGSSGMLALDRNGDGIINDGSELFGARTGDGFAELTEYDEDGNGYIDEADSIFDQLLIWNKTSDTDLLESLKDRDIGAIYLGASATPFDIKGEGNQHNGTVRNSGVYFSESGEVGTLQQIDMVV
ncbi:hypothetical protein [Amphritea pacifica]|uniref:VCBS repeat-containing protein n=1 Tax=Amphritea pacifica TaxID=2811233 RepID=A0ABS2WDG4_9GAMM|nr:hypothetical protein [Amphritea pacifica]MBN0989562.1 hypothetical protein [Amphritea pacifica]